MLDLARVSAATVCRLPRRICLTGRFRQQWTTAGTHRKGRRLRVRARSPRVRVTADGAPGRSGSASRTVDKGLYTALSSEASPQGSVLQWWCLAAPESTLLKFLPWLFLLGGVVSSAVAAGLVILKVVAADETALPAASFSAVLTILVFAQVLGLTGVLGLARRLPAVPVQPLKPLLQPGWRSPALHLSALSIYAGLPLGQLWLPLLLWQRWRRRSPRLDADGRAALNFALSTTLYFLVAMLLVLVLIGFVLLAILVVFQITMVVNNVWRARHGAPPRYLLSFNFLD